MMIKLLLLGVTLGFLLSSATGQTSNLGYTTREEIITHTGGYKVERAPTYIIVTPRKVRPSQVFQVFATILKLEFGDVRLTVSIVKDRAEYAENVLTFDQRGSRMMQLLMPANAQPGDYKVRVKGTLNDGSSGYLFFEEKDLEFEPKQASVFIQLSKPIYRQGQTVHFRVIPILPNMMPRYGSLTIYVDDPTGFPVRRWLGLQTNAGGFVSQRFNLSDQPNYGNWTIRVDAYGYTYRKHFLVEEFWDPRFDVNVTVQPYFMANQPSFGGRASVNITTGRPSIGNASVTLTIIPPEYNPYGRNNWNNGGNNQFNQYINYRDPYDLSQFPQLYRSVEYFKGHIDFSFTREEIWNKVSEAYVIPSTGLVDFELKFNVTAKDWFFELEEKGYASSVIMNPDIKLMWVGEPVRTFKPNSVISVAVAVMTYDGRPIISDRRVRFDISCTGGSCGSLTQYQPGLREIQPIDGIAPIDIAVDGQVTRVDVTASFDNNRVNSIQMKATRYVSPSKSYITVRTSTESPQVNEYMIFHARTSHYVPKIFYQVVAGGNILIGDELEMKSRHKTFAVALSREMVPMARVVVYYLQSTPEEVVVDVINFHVNGTRSNPVSAEINLGKDFTRDSIEINAVSDPGSYVAFTAMPEDLYNRGLNDGMTENNLIDELLTYDAPAKGGYRHLWRRSETEYEYKFFTANGYGIDANTTFHDAGLIVLSDARVYRIPNTCDYQMDMLPCFAGGDQCYHKNRSCDSTELNFSPQCSDWADEQGCAREDPRYNKHTSGMINRVSRVLRFYEDSGWAWQERFVKPDSMVQFRVDVPKYPLTWVINGLSISRDLGLGMMTRPLKYNAARYMYIIVEAPELAVRGEQIGVRVSVFNYWYNDDYLEVLVTMKDGGDNYKFVWVDELGIVSAYAPRTVTGDHQTIVFLEPGESKDIFLPIVPNMVQGTLNFTVEAFCYMQRDSVTKTVKILPDGVLNYYNIPYLLDMIRYSSESLPNFQVPVPELFVVPEVREHQYVPGSGVAQISLFGDVVVPGFFQEYLTAEDIFRKPYGSAEMNMFNFGYNLLTLKFMKANQQLPPAVLSKSLAYMNVALQRQLSYMNPDGSFRMFRDDDYNSSSSVWLSAFVVKHLFDAEFGEWERDLFIPKELINKIVSWLCSAQNETGAWYSQQNEPIYDRIFTSNEDARNGNMYGHPVPLTAYVLISLYSIKTEVRGEALSCIEKARQRASAYLSEEIKTISNSEVFFLAITAYALSLSKEKSRDVFDRLWNRRRVSSHIYFADQQIPDNPSEISNTIRYLHSRTELMNDGYGVQSTAYALMAHIKHNGMGIDSNTKSDRDSMMKWINSMRNFVGGFASTQDTLVAMEALFEFTKVDPNRNVFEMLVQVEASSQAAWREVFSIDKSNYTTMVDSYLSNVWGSIPITALGTGRAMLQLTTTVNVEYSWLLKPTQAFPDPSADDPVQFFELTYEYNRFFGRNSSIMEMNPCVSWVYTDKSYQSGLAVLEVDIPTGYVIMNHTLREYVNSDRSPPNLKRAEFYHRKVVFYFSHVDTSKTCVYFRADRWYPAANMTIQHRMRVYDYYEPGMHNTSMYTTYNMFNLNICYVCGSYQCPYCPFFNVATAIKASFTFIALILGFFLKKYILRTS